MALNSWKKNDKNIIKFNKIKDFSKSLRQTFTLSFKVVSPFAPINTGYTKKDLQKTVKV